MGNQVISWNNDEVKILKSLAGKISTAKIAKQIGRTRHAVKNKIERMGLPRFNPKAPVLEVKESVKKKVTVFPYGKELKPKTPKVYQSQIEWCPVCHAAVSNWQEHLERMGHRRPI